MITATTTHYQREYFRNVLSRHFSVEEIEMMIRKWISIHQLYDQEQQRRDQGGDVELVSMMGMLDWPIEKCLSHLQQSSLDSNHTTYAMQIRVAREYLASKRNEARKGDVEL